MKNHLAAVEQEPAPKFTIKAVHVFRPDGRDQIGTPKGHVPCLPIYRDAVDDIVVSGGLVRVTLKNRQLLTIPLSLCVLVSEPEPAK